jgi:hypothetical protein
MYYLHADPWEAPDGRLLYRCACCDLFVEGAHLKRHSRERNLFALRWTGRVLLRLSSRRPLMRGADPSENLVQLALDRERDRARESVPA